MTEQPKPDGEQDRFEMAGDRDRQLPDRFASCWVALVAERPSQPGQEAGAERANRVPERVQRLLEQVDNQRVRSGTGPDDAAAIPEGGCRERLVVTSRASDGGGAQKSIFGTCEVACSGERVAQRKEQPAFECAVGCAVECERGEGELVEPRCFLVGQQLRRLVTGSASKVDRLGCVSAGRCEREVVGEFGEMWLAVTRVEIFECFARAPMQRHPTPRAQTVVEGVADHDALFGAAAVLGIVLLGAGAAITLFRRHRLILR